MRPHRRGLTAARPDRLTKAGRVRGQAGWTVRIPPDFELATVKPNHFAMLVILERLCQSKSYTWATNATIAKTLGRTKRQAEVILREMQAAGYIYRIATDPDQKGSPRAGIFLHKRLDADLPVEDRPPPPEALERLWAARNRTNEARPKAQKASPLKPPVSPQEQTASRAENNVPPHVENCAGTHVENFVQKEEEARTSFSLKEEEVLNDEAGAFAPERQRPNPEPEPQTPGLTSAPLTPGQQQCIEMIPDELKPRWESIDPKKRVHLLRPHGRGFDQGLFKMILLPELAKVRLAETIELPPTGTAELVERLAKPGTPEHWSQLAAEDLARAFGTSKDQSLWGQFHLIMRLVWRGSVSAEHVVSAYRQAMKPKIKNRGAKFWAAFKCLSGFNESDLKRAAS